MKKNIQKLLAIGLLTLLIGPGINTASAEDSSSATLHHINTTNGHLDLAEKAINENQLETAQEHLKIAGQAAKNIIGGSFEVKAQRGARAIGTAKRLVKEGDSSGALTSLKQAREIFNSMQGPSSSGGRGGLN